MAGNCVSWGSPVKKNVFKRRAQESYRKCKAYGKKEPMFYKKTTDSSSNLCLTNLDLHIYLHDTSAVLPTRTIHTVSTDYVLNTAKNGKEMFKFIIQKTLKNNVIIDYETCIPSISSLLEQFQKRHKRFHYFSVLKQLTKEQKLDQKPKCNYAISIKQLKLFFNLVFTNVVPLNIFGKLKNYKKIKKATFHFLNTPRFKSFNLMPLVEKLDILSITWLKNIQSTHIQLLVIAKFIKWFFTGFLIKILRTQFHVTTFSTTNNERLYIIRSTWHNIQKKFIRKKIHSNCLQPNIIFNRWQPPIGVYKLCPKRSSIRPLFVSEHQPNDQRNLNIIFKFLKQLHNTEYGLTNFKEEWTSIIRHKNDSKIEKLHIVSSDVVDAFGAIIQSRLYDIIQLLCEKLPNQLMLKEYGVKTKNYVYNGSVCYIEYFSGPHLQLPITLERLFKRPYTNDSNSKVVLKSWLLNKIKNYIFHQRVKIRTKIYIIGKGVVQGAILSPILSDIYYNFILHKHMAIFINCGKIIRYVDDILYVTENENFAEQFLQLTKTGIQQYNCYFQESKTQCNKTTNSISYIGYKINCHTLEIVPKYQNTDISCSMLLSFKDNQTPIEVLKQRLHNIATLKLSKFVLNNAINSETTIKNILQKACLRQASRACILIKEIPVYKRKNVRDIRKIIKSSNYKIARNITKYFLTFEGEMSTWNLSAWNRDILRMLWTSYKNVFNQDKVLRKYFHFS